MNKLAALPPDTQLLARAIAKKLFVGGAEKVYVALNGDRLYVGREPATKFADREGTPENVALEASDV